MSDRLRSFHSPTVSSTATARTACIGTSATPLPRSPKRTGCWLLAVALS